MAKRRRTFRRKQTRKGKKARKVARLGTVKRMINSMIEHKWRTQLLNGAASYDAPVALCINQMIKGTARLDRIANTVRAASLEIGFVAAANKTDSTLRFMVFFDKQCNSAVFPLNSLFADGVPASTNVVSAKNPDFWPSRFTILYDKLVTVGIQGGANDINQEKRWRVRINLKKTRVQYNDGNAGTIADINKNALWVLVLSDEIASGGFVPNCTADITYRYEDA